MNKKNNLFKYITVIYSFTRYDILCLIRFKICPQADFSGGPVVKNQPGNARDVGLLTGQGTELPHATGK